MKILDFSKSFSSEEDCEKYLKELREKEGLSCKCGHDKFYWDSCNKCWICKECRKRITLRSGTLFHASNLPLMDWFTAIHLITSTKKGFSAKEMQRQLGRKRYQPVWEMMHKIRSVMGVRDDRYTLKDEAELDEAFFTSEAESKDEDLKRGAGSQQKTKVLVMVESKKCDASDKYEKDRKAGHLKMKVIPDLKADTIKDEVEKMADSETKVVADNAKGHGKVGEVVKEVEIQTVGKREAHKLLPWVHTAISNAKSLFADLFHGMKREFVQLYLNEFCYKFNRRTMTDILFDRLIYASVLYRPTFAHKIYNKNLSCDCG